MARKVEVPPHPKAFKLLLARGKSRAAKKMEALMDAALCAELERMRRFYERGRHEALLSVVALLLLDRAGETWVAQEFCRRLEAWECGSVPDLAAAFGVKGIKRGLMVHRWEIISAIVNRRRQGMSREDAIAEVAELFNASTSAISKIYGDHPRLRKLIESFPTLGFYPRS